MYGLFIGAGIIIGVFVGIGIATFFKTGIKDCLRCDSTSSAVICINCYEELLNNYKELNEKYIKALENKKI